METNTNPTINVPTDSCPASSPKLTQSTQKIGRRVSGKPWKRLKTATRRSQLPRCLRKSWDDRLKERKEKDAMKLLEQKLKDEVESEKKRKREIALKRKEALEEKERLEKLASIYSAKKLKRLQKKQGRSSKKK
ncbi:rRNA-processing protein CGR1 [Gigaspora margarita]|uniref:rRNA-processing protein n=1 Tax=Gigaspora margarita TaxID=4874 RepID=A0A8H3X0G1_GIGMA|nr:rRNA-processing protein CGR1 [Gigaspora margarita]